LLKAEHRAPGSTSARRPPSPMISLGLAAVAFALSLGAVIRVSALPAEARHREVWYSYQQDLSYSFTAQVVPSGIYPNATVAAEDLLRVRLPVDPPAYRRILVGKLTDSIRIDLPYKFSADRAAEMRATYRVEGMLSSTNLWQRPYPLMAEQEVRVNGTQLDLGQWHVDIPIKEIIAEIRQLSKSLEMGFDPVELKIRPVVSVEVAGQPEPVKTVLSPEITIQLRGGDMAVELDDPKVTSDGHTYDVTQVLPYTVSLLGYEVQVVTLRRVALIALGIFAGVLALMLVLQWLRRKTQLGEDLKRLGSALISAKGFEIPESATVVDVGSAEQMVALHLQTEKPVIQVGGTCYLQDGMTCYRLARNPASGDD
jgi:hypothetical protein